MRNILLAFMLLMFPVMGLASSSSLDNPRSPDWSVLLDIEQETCAVSETEVDLSRVEIALVAPGYGNGFEVNDNAKDAIAFRIEDPGRDRRPSI